MLTRCTRRVSAPSTAPCAHEALRTHHAARADHGAGLDHRQRADLGHLRATCAEACTTARGMHAGVDRRARMQQRGDAREGGVGIGMDQRCNRAAAGMATLEDHGAEPRVRAGHRGMRDWRGIPPHRGRHPGRRRGRRGYQDHPRSSQPKRTASSAQPERLAVRGHPRAGSGLGGGSGRLRSRGRRRAAAAGRRDCMAVRIAPVTSRALVR